MNNLNENELLIWRRGWEDTFTAAGRTAEDAHQWLKRRLEKEKAASMAASNQTPISDD